MVPLVILKGQQIPMATISPNASSLAVINLFPAANEEEQDDILRRVTDLTEQVMIHLPGFISANLHRSIPSSLNPPGTFFVANYAQWETAADIAAMLQDPKGLALRKELTSRYPGTGVLLRPVSTHSSDGASSTTLSEDCVTLINLFQAANKKDQGDILHYLTDITEEVMMHLPGFIAANLHRGIPSPMPPANTLFVVNYAQWETSDDFVAMRQDPRVIEHVKTTASRYSRTRALFRLVSSFPAQNSH